MSGSDPRRAPAWRRALSLWGRDVRSEVSDELSFHVEMRAAEFEARGHAPDEARRLAMARVGDVARHQRECEEIDTRRRRVGRRREWLGALRQDLRHALRGLRRQPLWTAVIVLTLGLGIGVNASIFSVVNAMLFRPLPVPDARGLVVIAGLESASDVPTSISYPNILDLRSLGDVFADVAGWSPSALAVKAGGDAERQMMGLVTDGYFEMLAPRMARGRAFTSAEVRARQPVMVLSHDYWQSRLGGDPAVVGRVLEVNGVTATVVGVTEPAFHGASPILQEAGWLPATLTQQLFGYASDPLESRGSSRFKVIGRLRPEAGVASARSAVSTLAGRLRAQYPDEARGLGFMLAPEVLSRPDISLSAGIPRVAAVFLALAALVLLVACANVAALLLARATARRAEFALRGALGAGRSRLGRQMLTETALVAVGGAAVGLALAYGAVAWLGSIRLSTDMPVHFDLRPDGRVLLFVALAALVATLAAGIAPALRVARQPLGELLREGGRGGSGGRRQRLRGALVVAQVAMTLLLLVAAGLLVRGAQQASRVDLGFRAGPLLMSSVDVGLARYDRQRGEAFYRRLLEGAAALPGARSVALAHEVPLGYNSSLFDLFADVPALATTDGQTTVGGTTITPGYLATMGIRLLDGRDFTARDDSTAPRVVLVNAALAGRLWPDGVWRGRSVRSTRDGEPLEVVGVVGTVKQFSVREPPRSFIYFPFGQHYESEMTLHVRAASETGAEAMAVPVRALAADLDPALPLYDVKTMRSHLDDGIAFVFTRLAATLAATFGLLALVQAVVGLYGLLAYAVSLRAREFGVRLALGARTADVLRIVLGNGLRLTLAGVGVGLALAIVATRYLAGLLNGVSPTDPVTFGGAAAVLVATALAAAYLPARRAARVSPAEALRDG